MLRRCLVMISPLLSCVLAFRCERCQASFIKSSCVCNPPSMLVSSCHWLLLNNTHTFFRLPQNIVARWVADSNEVPTACYVDEDLDKSAATWTDFYLINSVSISYSLGSSSQTYRKAYMRFEPRAKELWGTIPLFHHGAPLVIFESYVVIIVWLKLN